MRAELRALHAPDAAAGDLRAFVPEDVERFALAVEASIGPAGEEGEELFGFTVCSPKWLADQPLPKGFAFQRSTLLLERWDPDLVQRAISDLCRRTEAATWSTIAEQLSRFGSWEFEDYREHEGG